MPVGDALPIRRRYMEPGLEAAILLPCVGGLNFERRPAMTLNDLWFVLAVVALIILFWGLLFIFRRTGFALGCPARLAVSILRCGGPLRDLERCVDAL